MSTSSQDNLASGKHERPELARATDASRLRIRLAGVGGIGCAAWLAGCLCFSITSPPDAAAQPKQRTELATLYFGNSSCGGASCHGNMKPATERGQDKLDGASTVFSRHHELHLWDSFDRHKIATRVLTDARGKRMAELLGIKGAVADPKNNQQWRQCLTCHGVALADEKNVDPESFGPKQRIDNGVTCVVCHGPHPEWVNAHVKPVGNTWRTLTREQKKEQYGLNDLWDPATRAELCCSCHVGNAAEGKFVNHEMYAAGHPPLPGFEIVTFSEAMPRHWETLQEKYQRLPEHRTTYENAYHLGDDPDAHQFRLLVASALIALRNSTQLVATQAKPGNERDWPEFALYDCYACHHDLKADSWRLKRGAAGKPGRPQMREWPTALMPLAIASNSQADYQQKLSELQSAFSKVPFGDPGEVGPKATALAEWCDGALKHLRESRVDRTSRAKLLSLLAHESEKTLLDFDSARQVGWALRVLLGEAADAVKEASVKEPLDRLSTQLMLTLPRGPQPIVGEHLQASMAKLAEYDAVEFQRNLRALAKLLPKQ
jgi:hypothetical protein